MCLRVTPKDNILTQRHWYISILLKPNKELLRNIGRVSDEKIETEDHELSTRGKCNKIELQNDDNVLEAEYAQ